MDMIRIESLMQELRKANEVEVAAKMSLADSEFMLTAFKRKVNEFEAKLQEAKDATAKAQANLSQAVNAETVAPLLLTRMAED